MKKGSGIEKETMSSARRRILECIFSFSLCLASIFRLVHFRSWTQSRNINAFRSPDYYCHSNGSWRWLLTPVLQFLGDAFGHESHERCLHVFAKKKCISKNKVFLFLNLKIGFHRGRGGYL